MHSYELSKFRKLGLVSLMSHRAYLTALKVTGRAALLVMSEMKKS